MRGLFLAIKKYPFLKERHIFQKRGLFASSFSFHSNKIWAGTATKRNSFFLIEVFFFSADI